MSMKDFVHSVILFNQEILKIDPREIAPMEHGEHQATVKAFKEEVGEYEVSFENFDLIGQVDAVIDLMYFAIGALYKKGLTADQILRCMEAVHEANMTKKKGIVEKRGNPNGDAVKPEGWVGPEERIAAVLGG